MALVFVDTNVVVYALSEGRKTLQAKTILAEAPLISVQTLNEFLNVCRRKLKLDWDTADEATADLLMLCPIVLPVAVETHLLARKVAKTNKLQVYDAVVLASALLAGCEVFFSEDMHDGLVIENQLTIRNPFA